MTEEQLDCAIQLKRMMNPHKNNLAMLKKYKEDIDKHRGSIIKYFCNNPLYDVSLHKTLDYFLDKEIEACEEIIKGYEERIAEI